jgi:hypothetical protein
MGGNKGQLISTLPELSASVLDRP